jgi:TetR/AcrR family transcriptional regulator, mexJK operon transcriptional repressor
MASITPVRVNRGEAILNAALEVFGRDGYADAKVDEIARRAGVAKPTIYNRFGDKRSLFVEAVNRGVVRAGERTLAAIAALDPRPVDLRRALEDLGGALVHCVAHEEGAAVVRLQLTERPRFSGIIDGAVNRERTVDALAGKLAQLATGGHLRLTDARRAASQFLALVTDDTLVRSGMGERVLAGDEVDGPVRDGVDTFLAAFGVSDTPD